MAHDMDRPRGVKRVPKRPNAMPIDRGRINKLEEVVENKEPAGGA